jgi:NADH-quinone oxidoreductase subunit C
MSNWNNETLLTKLSSLLGDKILAFETTFDLLNIEVAPENVHALIKELKEDTDLKMAFLTLLGATHFPEKKGKEIAMNYHLHSLVNNVRLRIRAFISIEAPRIKSITDIYVGANWQERETYDFFGVIFEGHPNLTRILNEDSMDYFPMRKEYHLEDATREDKDDRYFGR